MANITTDQEFPSAVIEEILDSKGRPATVQGSPVWASSDETVLSVVAGSDGMSAKISTVAPGSARISVKADADLGEGVTEITGVSEDIVVTQGTSTQAATFKITLGTPVDKA